MIPIKRIGKMRINNRKREEFYQVLSILIAWAQEQEEEK